MTGKGDVVELHGGREAVVTQGVLLADVRRVEKGHIEHKIREKAQGVDGREVDSRPAC